MEGKEEDKTPRYMLPGFRALMGNKRPPEWFIFTQIILQLQLHSLGSWYLAENNPF